MPTEELFGAYHFLLEIQGVINDNKIIVGGFKSVSGMDSETEIVEFKQGNDMVVRKKPGRTTYANISLERGYTATDDLWQWAKNMCWGRSTTVHPTIETAPPIQVRTCSPFRALDVYGITAPLTLLFTLLARLSVSLGLIEAR